MKSFRLSFALCSTLVLAACLLPGGRALAAGCPKPDFQAARVFPVGDVPLSAFSADFNGDGSRDLALANSGSNTVSILIGTGDASFQPAVHFAIVGLAPGAVAAGDFNLDGSQDLVLGNTNSKDISTLRGNGNGTFQSAVSIPIPTAAGSILVADFNLDGKPDLVAGNYLLPGNGDGTFQAPVFVAGSARAIGDLNGDSKPDIVGSNMVVMLGNGDGTFQTVVNPSSATQPGGVTIGDFNGDNKADVAVTDSVVATGGIWVHLGNGDGTVQAGVAFAVGPSSYTPSPLIVTADFNADGSLDLAVGASPPGAIFTLRGNGNGTFQAGVELRRIWGITGLLTDDFNGDGSVDLAGANLDAFPADALLLVGNGDGTFQNDRYYPTGAVPQDVATADFNNDGKLDMVVANSNATTATVRLGIGNGTFFAKNDYPVGTHPQAVVTGDFNADGSADFATVNLGPPSDVTVRLGNGNGTFQAVVTYPTIFGGISLLAADVDRDGKLDLLSGFIVGAYFLKGVGNGTFQTPVYFGTWPVQGNPSTADLNGDQKLDLVVAVGSVDKVSVILGNGNGTFQSNVDYATGVSPQSATIGDFNADGKQDLAVMNYGCRVPDCGVVPSTSSISVLLGNGNGTFKAAVNYPTAPFSKYVRAGDLNGDGRDDLAVVNFLPGTVSVLLSNSNGTFQAAQGFGVQQDPSDVAFADLDGNGGLDMLVPNRVSNDVSILLNNCTGSTGGGAEADLVLTLTDSPDPASIGSNLTYTLGVTNNGPSSVTNVMATATLPASVSFQSATAGCVEAGGTVTCNAGSLGIGANTTLMIVVTPNLATTISATASVTSDQVDPVSINNSAAAGTTVQGPSCADLTGTYSSVTPKCKDKKGVTTCTIKATMSVQNLGNVTSATSVLAFYLSGDAVLGTPGDTLLQNVAVKAVKTTKAGKAKLKAGLAPGVLTAGQYVIAVFDAAGTIAECNEANNTTVYGPLP